jgi:NadR type nicotinamide-nucleotide adenylyltransferase
MAKMEKDAVKKIAVIGAESTGKTFLCERLAAHFETNWVPEYAREYFNDSDIYNYTLEDLVIIAQKQLELEIAQLSYAKKFLFCDTSLITLKIWAELEFESVPLFITENLPKIKYHHYLITDNSIPWMEDHLRQNKFSRDLLFELNVNEVKKLGGRYNIITGSSDEKLAQALKVLETL